MSPEPPEPQHEPSSTRWLRREFWTMIALAAFVAVGFLLAYASIR